MENCYKENYNLSLDLEKELKRLRVIKIGGSTDIGLNHNYEIVLWDDYDVFDIANPQGFLTALKSIVEVEDRERVREVIKKYTVNCKTWI